VFYPFFTSKLSPTLVNLNKFLSFRLDPLAGGGMRPKEVPVVPESPANFLEIPVFITPKNGVIKPE